MTTQPPSASPGYDFGSFHLEPDERVLLHAGQPVPLTPKVFETLLALVERRGHIVTKEELMRRVWPDTFVEDVNLAKNVSTLRKILGVRDDGREYIETIPKRGYRFVAEKLMVEEELASVAATNAPTLLSETNAPFAAAFAAQPVGGAVNDDAFRLKARPLTQHAAVPVSESGRAQPLLARRVGAPQYLVWAAAFLLLFGAASGYWFYNQNNPNDHSNVPATWLINRITTNSNAFETAISPDGQFVAYVLGGFGRQSLWIKQVASSNSIQLSPFAETRYRGLAFSPDGSFLYFARRDKNQSELVLYRLPLLGGRPKQILIGVDSVVTFSPDGAQLAFVREYPTHGESALIIANIDGSGERKLAVHKSPLFYSVDGPAWSPDGKTIAAALCNAGGDFHYRIMLTPVTGGAEQPLGEQRWGWAMRVSWLADGSGLMMLARNKGESRNNQLWQLSYPEGKARRVINDLNDYRNLSLTADSKKLVTIQSEVRSDIWVAPLENINQVVRITNDPTSQNGYDGLDWSPDNKLVYTALANGQQDLWIMNADGSQARQLTDNMGNHDHYPSVSGDGHYVVFTSNKSGAVRLWRVNIDGSNPKQLTFGNLDLKPNCSPDGQWVVYSSERTGMGAIGKISKVGIDGGQEMQLTDKLSGFPVISPDGNLVACLFQEEANAPRRIALLPVVGGAPVKYLDIPLFARPTVRWYPDGQALSYISPQDDSSNIWLQPLSGTPPTRLTDFRSERIFAYAWSRDGRYLACARGLINRDVVMITGFK
jgi:eukaryotic-like serine/threonine-protein kinase